MTEIKIEKKKPVWPWILLTLIILGIIVYFVYANSDGNQFTEDFDDDFTSEKVMDTEDNQNNAAGNYEAADSYGSVYDEYSAFDQSITDSTRIAVDSSYTKKAFSNLTKLVVKQADKNDVEESDALDDLRSYSVLITSISNISGTTENFKNFKTACDKIASVMGDIQMKSYPALQPEVANLKQLASKISVSTPMNKQQTEINAFLNESRDILKSMN